MLRAGQICWVEFPISKMYSVYARGDCKVGAIADGSSLSSDGRCGRCN